MEDTIEYGETTYEVLNLDQEIESMWAIINGVRCPSYKASLWKMNKRK